jgi:long-chain acyl-CoA synthetase
MSQEGRILSGDRELTTSVLRDHAARAATGLASLGLRADDSIALVLRNDFAFFEASLAAAMLGVYAVPVNWHFSPAEIGFVLQDCEARAVVVHADLLRSIEGVIPEGVHVLVVPTPPDIRAIYRISEELGAVPAGRTEWQSWLAGFEPLARPAVGHRTSVIYTSGTTGRPKAVVREPAVGESARALADMGSTIYGITPGQPFSTVLVGPAYHSAPNLFSLLAVQSGGLVIMPPRFEPEELLQLVEQHRISHLHMVPIMFVRLLKLPEEVRRRYDVSSLRFVVHAAAPCPPEVKRQMIEWWGPIIHEYYGGTETGAVTFHGSEDALRKPGTVGRPWARGIVKILDAEGREVPPGQTGLVYLRIRDFPDFTYKGRPDERARISRDGLVTCGDIGYVDEEGFLFICDREKDMVISGGVNIYPAEIEAALIGMPGIRDCAVFGIPDAEFGESLAAHIELQPGATVDEATVREWLGARIARYKIPGVIRFDDALPREDSGKIFKRRIRDTYWAGVDRRI